MPWEGDLDGLTAALVRCRLQPAVDQARVPRQRELAAVRDRARAAAAGKPPGFCAGADLRRDRGRPAVSGAVLGGSNGCRARRRLATCSTSPRPDGRRFRRSSTRRCTARRCCSPSTGCTCARPTWRRFARPPARPGQGHIIPAAGTRTDPRGLRRGRCDRPGHRGQRRVGARARRRPGQDPRDSQRDRAAEATAPRRRAASE